MNSKKTQLTTQNPIFERHRTKAGRCQKRAQVLLPRLASPALMQVIVVYLQL
jgi:hypothetical protein